MNIVSITLMGLGLFFLLAAGVGAIRLPDFYTRSHALGVIDTLGTLFILGAIILEQGVSFVSAKLLLLLIFIYVANPTVTHVLLRAAMRSGLKPWTNSEEDSNG